MGEPTGLDAARASGVVPAAALRMVVGPLELGDNGEGAKSAPLRMKARTAQPVQHWFWGRVVHDMAGMRLHKDRLPVDYVHKRHPFDKTPNLMYSPSEECKDRSCRSGGGGRQDLFRLRGEREGGRLAGVPKGVRRRIVGCSGGGEDQRGR